MATGDDRREAFASARDTTKQLITLATSILTVTITFRNDVVPFGSADVSTLMMAAWIGYAASVGFGVFELLALTAELGQTRREPSTAHWSVRWPPVLQVLTFMAATVLIVWFGSSMLLAQR